MNFDHTEQWKNSAQRRVVTKKNFKDAVAQTVMTIPPKLSEDIEALIRPFCNSYTEDDMRAHTDDNNNNLFTNVSEDDEESDVSSAKNESRDFSFNNMMYLSLKHKEVKKSMNADDSYVRYDCLDIVRDCGQGNCLSFNSDQKQGSYNIWNTDYDVFYAWRKQFMK